MPGVPELSPGHCKAGQTLSLRHMPSTLDLRVEKVTTVERSESGQCPRLGGTEARIWGESEM